MSQVLADCIPELIHMHHFLEVPAALHNQVVVNIPFQLQVDYHLVEEAQMSQFVAD